MQQPLFPSLLIKRNKESNTAKEFFRAKNKHIYSVSKVALKDP